MLLARALLLLLAFVLLSPSAWAQETRDIQILVDGTPRRALLVNNFGPGQAVPVIIVILAFNFLGDGLRDAADPYG